MFFPNDTPQPPWQKPGVSAAGLTLLASAAACGVLLGIAVGATGIGGVLLVPFLTLALGIPVKNAIAAALMAYLPAGTVAVVLYARRGSIPWREARWICLAAVPAAYLGALGAGMAPAALLEALIGMLLLAGGLHALRRSGSMPVTIRPLTPLALTGLGGVTALASAMTGAGGAFVLVPLLLLLDAPVLNAEQIAVSNEFERHVAKAMDELPEKLRQALVLAAIEGYTTKEVAELLDLPEGTIKSRVHLARKQMAEKLSWLVKDTNRD